ncbi:MAG: transporter substrate-binding domain-containing protein [Alphaproteobacteria bacterium]|nr:transporter substrate-binding domain-containing protein [Alphaproteobacteria bacterium]
MKILLSLVVLLLAIPAYAADGGEAYDRVIKSNTLRCGIMLWPPYFEMDANTHALKGFGVDFYNAVAEILGIKITYSEIILGQQAEDLNRGKIDAVCNDGPYVFSAMKFVDYTVPAYYGPTYVYVSEKNTSFKTPDDLNKKAVRFVGMDGDLSSDLVPRHYPQAALQTLPATSDAAALMLQVSTGKADAVIIDPAAVDGFNAQNSPKLKPLFKESPFVYPVGMSVKKGEQQLLNMLNSGISALWNTHGALPILRKHDPKGRMFLPISKPYESKY